MTVIRLPLFLLSPEIIQMCSENTVNVKNIKLKFYKKIREKAAENYCNRNSTIYIGPHYLSKFTCTEHRGGQNTTITQLHFSSQRL